jgi:hypothetical protein
MKYQTNKQPPDGDEIVVAICIACGILAIIAFVYTLIF